MPTSWRNRSGDMECANKRLDGNCAVLSDGDVQQPCVEGPCDLFEMPFTPKSVIDNLRRTDEYISAIFMNGGCWQFYKFLKSQFPSAEPYKVSVLKPGSFDHIITKIGAAYYDIMGFAEPADYCECQPVSETDISQFEKWGFARNNLLFRRCPHCGEEILINTKGSIEEGM